METWDVEDCNRSIDEMDHGSSSSSPQSSLGSHDELYHPLMAGQDIYEPLPSNLQSPTLQKQQPQQQQHHHHHPQYYNHDNVIKSPSSNASMNGSNGSINSAESPTGGALNLNLNLNSPQGTTLSACLNLLSSMVGGGSLSLPLAFSLTGNTGMSPILLLFFALTADFSIQCLIDASRLSFGTGPSARFKSSYEAVANEAFGIRMRDWSRILVVLICFFGIVGYCILLRDLLDPIAHHFDPISMKNATTNVTETLTDLDTDIDIDINADLLTSNGATTIIRGPTLSENITMWIILLLITPLCTLDTLTSLKHVGAASMFSVTMVGVCITYRSYQCNFTSSDYHIRHGSWKSFLSFEPHNFNQVLTSLPLLLSCYICHFNVLTVHNEFRTPTKSKIQKTIHYTTFISTMFYLWIGWAGSMYANCTPSGHVQGNILLDFPDGDDLLLIGRFCLACTIALAFPMMVLPARDICVRLCADSTLFQKQIFAFTSSSQQSQSSPGRRLGAYSPPTIMTRERQFEMEHRDVWTDGLSALGEIGGLGMKSLDGSIGSASPSDYNNDMYPEDEEGDEEKIRLVSPLEVETDFFDPLLDHDPTPASPPGGVPISSITFPSISISHEQPQPQQSSSPLPYDAGQPSSLPPLLSRSIFLHIANLIQGQYSKFIHHPNLPQKALGIGFFWLAATLASFIHSVDTVWGLLGSSISILVGFLIPFASFVVISHKRGKHLNGGGYVSDFGSGRIRAMAARVLVVIYFVIMILCSWHAFVHTI